MPPRQTKAPGGVPTSQAAGKTQKSGAKPPKPLQEQLKRLFNSLCAQIDGGHLKNAIKTCEKILRLAPNDGDAQHAKLFLLIQTDQYGPALDHIQAISGPQGKDFGFEKAYLLYRLQHESEAEELVASLKSDSVELRGLQHLEAQIKYRKTDYDGARDLYNQLLDTCPPDTDEYPDLVTNLNATQLHLDFFESGWLRSLDSLETPVTALEEAGAPAIPTLSILPLTASSTAEARPAAAEGTHAAVPHPPRKARLPKHVVLGVTPMPDPERWLKKKERTRVEGRGGGKKGKKREGMTAGNTQGSSVPEKPPVPVSTPSATNKKGKKGK